MLGNVTHVCVSWVLAPYDTHISCAQEMCPTSQISCVHEMSPVLLSNIFIYARKCLQEMHLKYIYLMCPGLGNVPEILPYTVPGKVKEMSKFPGAGNVHAINNIHMCIHTYTYTGIYTHARIRTYTRLQTCTHIHIHTNTHTHT